MRAINLFHEAFANRADLVRVEGPTVLHHFAADVVLSIVVSDGVEVTLNVEFVSPKDFLALNSNFTHLRDSYLSDFHGVVVVRLRKDDMQNMQLESVSERLTEVLETTDIELTLRDQIVGVLCEQSPSVVFNNSRGVEPPLILTAQNGDVID